jgi:RNA polymerase sigma factor (sigma-70 family)
MNGKDADIGCRQNVMKRVLETRKAENRSFLSKPPAVEAVMQRPRSVAMNRCDLASRHIRMEKTNWADLRSLLADRYEELRRQLARTLGSDELACESLNETWLRLDRQDDISVPIHRPKAFLLRVALNVGMDRFRRESRHRRKVDDVASGWDIADPAPDPERIADGIMTLETLEHAIEALPTRTRKILVAARIDGRSQQEIAREFDISTRMVRIELRRALDQCEEFLAEIPDRVSFDSESDRLFIAKKTLRHRRAQKKDE